MKIFIIFYVNMEVQLKKLKYIREREYYILVNYDCFIISDPLSR